MYKIIFKYAEKHLGLERTSIYTYFDLEYCKEQLKVLKDRYASTGITIFELKIYKVEQIQDSEQI